MGLQKPNAIALFPGVATSKDIRVRVIIEGATGLRSQRENFLFVECKVPGKPQATYTTQVVQGSRTPEWKHSQALKAYSAGDKLIFSVYSTREEDRNRNRSTRRNYSRGAAQEECIGRAELLPDGFGREVRLDIGNGAMLSVTAIVTEDGQEDGNVGHFGNFRNRLTLAQEDY